MSTIARAKAERSSEYNTTTDNERSGSRGSVGEYQPISILNTTSGDGVEG
jgi:hypothetical protein